MEETQGADGSAGLESVKVEQELASPRKVEEEQAGNGAREARSDVDTIRPKDEAEHGGESSGNNASNGTTQKVEKGEEAAADTSPAPKPPSDDLQELANRGLCAPLWRTAKPSQGVAVPDVDQLQSGWCNYNGLSGVQRCAIWTAASSPSAQASTARQQQLLGATMPLGLGAPRGFAGSERLRAKQQQAEDTREDVPHQPQQGVFSVKPPSVALPALPTSPFSKSAMPISPFHATRGDAGATLQNVLSGDSPFTPSTHTKFQWPEDAQSPRQSTSDGNHAGQRAELPNNSLSRQVSLPDFGELADLWAEMSNAPDEYNLDLDALPSLSKDPLGSLLPSQLSLGLRQNSLAKGGKLAQEPQTPVGSLLHDIKSHRRSRSMKINTALTWQPGLTSAETFSGPRRTSGRLQSLQMGSVRDTFMQAERTSSSGGFPSAEAARNQVPELPEQVQLEIVGAPSIFAVPTCINKTFKPPFTVRVTIISSHRTQIKATVAAYTLQKEQVARLEQWHPSQHIFTESLAGSIVAESIVCDGPGNRKTGETLPGKHVGTGDLIFTDLKFNASSRMKPRWLVFALALPTDDVIFVQYTVPTIVMSRQCDQTPKALAILRGEVPSRKRARQAESGDSQRAKMVYSGVAQAPVARATPPPNVPFMHSPTLTGRPIIQPTDQGSITAGNGAYNEEGEWPQRGPFTMARWREAIVKVCREFGLTRSFEQEDMHELAKVAGFMGPPQLGGQQPTMLTVHQWSSFGRWFLSYLHIFKDHRDLWMSASIVCICSFSVTRERAEQLLMAQPEGTFLLRPSLSMDSTIVISVVASGRVFHLALDGQQLDARSIEEWVRDLPEVSFLLDINSGMRYAKQHVFRDRRMLTAPLEPLMGYQGALMQPIAPQAINTNRMMAPPPQGQDALAHILDASRTGGAGFSQLGQYSHSPVPLSHMGGHGADHLGRLFDQWGSMDARDPFKASQVGGALGLDPHGFSPHNHMRFGGH